MNNRQKLLVLASFEQARPIAGQVARAFYRRLVEIDPSVKPLLRGDAREQERRLMGALQMAVGGIYRLDRMVPALQGLGCRHAAAGFQPEHYRASAAALLWALENELGEAFTPEVKDAWAAAMRAVEESLIAAGAQAGVKCTVSGAARAVALGLWPPTARPAWGRRPQRAPESAALAARPTG